MSNYAIGYDPVSNDVDSQIASAFISRTIDGKTVWERYEKQTFRLPRKFKKTLKKMFPQRRFSKGNLRFEYDVWKTAKYFKCLIFKENKR